MNGDVDTSQPSQQWMPCHDLALYEAQSTQNHAAGYPSTPVCSRHAEFARRHWDVHFIRSLAPTSYTN